MENYGKDAEMFPMILEMLTALASECNSQELHLHPERRKFMYAELESSAMAVMKYLVNCQQGSALLPQKQILCA